MRGLLLHSGGIDSPVAAYIMGSHDLSAVHFDICSSINRAQKSVEKLRELLKKEIPLYVVPYDELLNEFVRTCGKEGRKYTCIFCKRMMLRIAEQIALTEGCTFLITGENLGQVASQTLQNVYVISRAVDMPVVRPLIGLDKLDIIALAEKIGTYDISVRTTAACKTVPQYPAVRAQLENIEDLEDRLDIEGLLTAALEHTERY